MFDEENTQAIVNICLLIPFNWRMFGRWRVFKFRRHEIKVKYANNAQSVKTIKIAIACHKPNNARLKQNIQKKKKKQMRRKRKETQNRYKINNTSLYARSALSFQYACHLGIKSLINCSKSKASAIRKQS